MSATRRTVSVGRWRPLPAPWLGLALVCVANFALAQATLPSPVDSGAKSATTNASNSRERMRAAFAAQLPDATVTWSELSGGPELVANQAGALSPAAPGASSESIVRGFLASHRQAYGLELADLDQLVVLGDSRGGTSGLRMLRIEQRLDGVPIFLSETRFLLDREGRLWRSVGTLFPYAAAHAPGFDRARLLAPSAALVRMLAVDGIRMNAADIVSADGGNGRIELTAPAPVTGTGSARLVLFPLGAGALVPAWALTVFTLGEADWYAVVDAQNGELLWRRNLREYASTQPARFGVYVQADGKTPADNPAPQSPNAAVVGASTQYPTIARTSVSMQAVQNLTASPNGWIDDCPGGANRCDTTAGNNGEACLDRDGNDICDATLDLGGRPQGNLDAGNRNRDFLGPTPRDFEYSPPPLAGNPNAGDAPTNADYQRGAAVQVFYLLNWYHDRLYALGFDEAAGNFQQVNLHGAGGLAGDRVAADVQDGGVNGANSSTPADGAGALRLQFGLETAPAPDRDEDLSADTVIHELTHGLSHRLVGNSTGLLWDPARSMGEGWSDFYALALLNPTNADLPNANYSMIAWSNYQVGTLTDNYVYGIRRFPYSTNNAINPLTWADVDAVTVDETGGIVPSPLNFGRFGALEVHNAGTLWALSLWEVRARLIADAAGANGDVPIGNETMLQLVTDAMKMTPANPSFIDGRDALFAADCATHGCANERSIWGGFADRGLGYKAIAPLTVMGRFAIGRMAVGTSFETPYLDVLDPTTQVLINDAPLGNGNGRLDPGETATLTVFLSNPWRAPSSTATGVSATLSSTTPGVTVSDPNASYPVIAPLATTAPSDTFQISISPALICGERIAFDLQTTSSLGTRTAHFSVRVGAPNGVGPTLTYTATPNLAIPISKTDGVASTLAVTDDFEISDLNFRVDSLIFPVTAHLSVMLRAPNGNGGDLIWRRGGFMSPNQGLAADFTHLVIDDDLPIVAAEDLNQSLATQAPFTGDWLPAFNSPFWDSYRPSPAPISHDPVGNLSRMDGSSTKGTWTVSVANGSATITGTLASWSLLVQPKAFACMPFVQNSVFANGFE